MSFRIFRCNSRPSICHFTSSSLSGLGRVVSVCLSCFILKLWLCLNSYALSSLHPHVCDWPSSPMLPVSNCPCVSMPPSCIQTMCPFLPLPDCLIFPVSSPALFPCKPLVFDPVCSSITEFTCPRKLYLCFLV